MLFFGRPDATRPVPVGQKCLWCEEEIKEGDKGVMMPYVAVVSYTEEPVHIECLMRQVLGSVGHQKGLCPCYKGTEEDPPGMTKREAAHAAYQFSRRRF